MPTITQLEYILAVDKEKHFARAAEACHVSQPSLSMQIQKAEEELGITIFDRAARPIVATETGRVIIEQAKLIIREHKKLGDLANDQGHEARGDFHLAVIPTLAPYLIPLFVGEFSRKFPKVQLKINEYKTNDIVRLLVNDEIDAGLLVTPLNDGRLTERHLFFEPFHAYISPDHPLSHKKFLSEMDLDGKDLWLLEEGHCFREQVLKVCSLDKKGTVLPNVEFASGNLETLKNLVKKNSGLTLLPDLAVRDLSEEEREGYVRDFKKPIPTREVGLIHGKNFHKHTIIKALEDVILEGLPKKIRSLKRQDIEVIDL